MTEKCTGETLTLNVGVTGEQITSLDGAKIVFRAIHKESGRVIDKVPEIIGMTMTARLESEETLVPGIYSCEFRGVFSDITISIFRTEILFQNAVIREVIDNG